VSGKALDFDAAWREAYGPAPTIVVFGETITLPDEMPAVVWLARERNRQRIANGEEAETSDVFDLLGMVVGGEMVTRWREVNHIGFQQAWALLGMIGSAYRSDEDEAHAKGTEPDEQGDGGDPEAPAPATGQTDAAPSATSSSAGAGSSPTSSASTTST
jgi:hypothetical protein